MSINFNLDGSSVGTSLRGYLYAPNFYKLLTQIYPDREFNDTKFPFYNFDTNLKILQLTFEEIVARLYNLSNQEIFQQGDGYKLSFEVFGTYKGEIFTLYDYKGEFDIHIGGSENLDINGLRKELDDMIMQSKSKPYNAKTHYDNNIVEYHYP